jgi:uncharacterized protein (TIGR03118 family)
VTVFGRSAFTSSSRRRRLDLETLDDRTLLATLDIVTSGSGSWLVKNLTYTGTTRKVNDVTVSTTGITGKYTFKDTGETITLGPGALSAGWTGSGTNTVTGPDSSVTLISVNTGDMNDTVVVQSIDAPTTLSFNNSTGNVDTVTLGSDPKKGVEGLSANVTIVNVKGTTNLTVDDSADTKGRTINLSGGTITGLIPTNTGLPLSSGTIDFSNAKLGGLVINESNNVPSGDAGTTLTATGTPGANTVINTGVGSVNSTTVQASGSTVTINAQGTDSITLGGTSKALQFITGQVTLTTSSGGSIASLVADDSSDINPQTSAQITSTQITGLAPKPIDYSGVTSMVALSVKGGQGGNTFTVASLPDAIVTLSTGAGATINPNSPNANVVNVQNTTDPANNNTLFINGQGEDTINLSSSVSVGIIGSTKLLTVPTSMVINTPGSGDSVSLINSSSGSLNGAMLLVGGLTSTALVLDDSADTSPRTALITVSSSDPTLTEIDGYMPAPITFNPDDLSSLDLIGANRLDTLNINANKHGPASVSPGPSIGTGTITIGSNLPIQFSNVSAINITNTADQTLIPINQAVVTQTGDLPTEGRALPFVVAQFTDEDVNGRSGNFTAVVNWGDGTITPGSIASQGYQNGDPLFTVTGTHTYAEAGTYPVIVTITDLSTGAIPAYIAGIPVTITDVGGSEMVTGSTVQTNLLSNGPISSAHTDPNVVNPWGLAYGPTGPFWLSDAGSGVSTVNNGSGSPVPPGPVTIPGPGGRASSPTGIVHNGGSGFVISGGPALFIFDTFNGTIDGWNGSLGGTAHLVVDNSGSGARYTGLALDANQLFAADFANQSIDVFDSSFHPVTLSPGAFTDSAIPSDYAPYGVQNIGGALYVTYAKLNAARTDVVPGLGNGYVDVYNNSGTLLTRFAANAHLNAPWGVALAPASFGQYGGDLLVANHGDGTIAAFNPSTGEFLGYMINNSSQILTIDGLRGLVFGNGGSAGSTGTLFFTSGPAGGTKGLFGGLDANPAIVAASGPNTAAIIDATVTAAITSITTVEGVVYSDTVATFTDGNPLGSASDFTAVIDWGDGSTTPGKIMVSSANPGNTYYVVPDPATNTHTYDETGVPPQILPFVLKVRITDVDGATVTVQGTANVSDANLVLAAGVPDLSVDEGSPLSVGGDIAVATFVDTNPEATANDYTANGQFGTALINWGDGSTSTGTVTYLQSTAYGPEFQVLGNHTYLKVGPSVISTSIVDIGGKTASASTNVVVNEAPLIDPTAAPLTGTEGVELVGVTVGSFVDSNPFGIETDYKASIDWGDGTAGSGIVQANGQGGFDVIASHRYTEAMPTGTAPGTPFDITTIVDDSAGDLDGARLEIDDKAFISDGTLSLISTSPVGAVENASAANVTLCTFTDTNPIGTASDFRVSIGWGDGTPVDTTTGSVSGAGLGPDGNVLFKVTGSHTYTTADIGAPLPIVIVITDLDGSTLVPTTTARVNDARLTSQAASPVITEGPLQPTAVLIATFIDADPAAVAGNFTATSTLVGTAPTITSTGANPNGRTFSVMQTIGSSEEGSIPFTVTITDTAAPAGSQAVTTCAGDVDVQDAPVSLKGNGPFTAFVGVNSTFNLANNVDGNPKAPLTDYTATIDWGDGSPISFGPVKLVGGNPTVTGSHTFTAPGVYKVNIKVMDVGGSVFELDPIVNVLDTSLGGGSQTPVQATEGVPFSGDVATFSYDNPIATARDLSATIDWGDSVTSSGTIVSLGQGEWAVQGTHTYQEDSASGSPSIVVTVSKSSGQTTTLDNTADVADAQLEVHGGPVAAVEGTSFTEVVVTFTDENRFSSASDFTVEINWGDGATDAGTITQSGSGPDGVTYVVTGTHTYNDDDQGAEAETEQIVTTITDIGGSVGVVASLAEVSDPVLTDPGINIVAAVGTPFSGPVATFSDATPGLQPSDFHVTIAWGDGSASAGQVQATGSFGHFEVLGTHTYTKQGPVPLIVSIEDPSGQSTSDASVATVNDTPIGVAGQVFSTQPRKHFAGVVASLTDSNPAGSASNFQVTIVWGDGTTSAGSLVAAGVSAHGAVFQIMGQHTYSHRGVYNVTVNVTDVGGSPSSALDKAYVGVRAPNQASAISKGASGAKSTGAAKSNLEHVRIKQAAPKPLVVSHPASLTARVHDAALAAVAKHAPTSAAVGIVPLTSTRRRKG